MLQLAKIYIYEYGSGILQGFPKVLNSEKTKKKYFTINQRYILNDEKNEC